MNKQQKRILANFAVVMVITVAAVIGMVELKNWVNRSEAMRAMEQFGAGGQRLQTEKRLDTARIIRGWHQRSRSKDRSGSAICITGHRWISVRFAAGYDSCLREKRITIPCFSIPGRLCFGLTVVSSGWTRQVSTSLSRASKRRWNWK